MSRLKCPTFLFWAADDETVTPDGTQQFATALSAVRQDVTIKTVPTGGHYSSMVDPGIGLAIQWLKALPGEQVAATADEAE
jgi:pimeloyl-ACP methyl ester carboxylesterase